MMNGYTKMSKNCSVNYRRCCWW